MASDIAFAEPIIKLVAGHVLVRDYALFHVKVWWLDHIKDQIVIVRPVLGVRVARVRCRVGRDAVKHELRVWEQILMDVPHSTGTVHPEGLPLIAGDGVLTVQGMAVLQSSKCEKLVSCGGTHKNARGTYPWRDVSGRSKLDLHGLDRAQALLILGQLLHPVVERLHVFPPQREVGRGKVVWVRSDIFGWARCVLVLEAHLDNWDAGFFHPVERRRGSRARAERDVLVLRKRLLDCRFANREVEVPLHSLDISPATANVKPADKAIFGRQLRFAASVCPPPVRWQLRVQRISGRAGPWRFWTRRARRRSRRLGRRHGGARLAAGCFRPFGRRGEEQALLSFVHPGSAPGSVATRRAALGHRRVLPAPERMRVAVALGRVWDRRRADEPAAAACCRRHDEPWHRHREADEQDVRLEMFHDHLTNGNAAIWPH